MSNARVPWENQDEFSNQRLTADRQMDHVTPRKRVAVGSGSRPHADVGRLMTIQVRKTGSGSRQRRVQLRSQIGTAAWATLTV